MTDFLDEKRKEIQSRLKELRPLVDEFHRLEAAERALAGVEDAPGAARRPGRRGAAVAAAAGRAPTGAAGARAAAARAPTRRSSWCAHAPASPSPSWPRRWSIKQNYLYRVMPGLADEGLVVKSGPRVARARRAAAPTPLPTRRVGGSPRTDTQSRSLTASRSSVSSAADASIRSREKASISSPSTIVHSPFAHVHGKLEMMPSGTS